MTDMVLEGGVGNRGAGGDWQGKICLHFNSNDTHFCFCTQMQSDGDGKYQVKIMC